MRIRRCLSRTYFQSARGARASERVDSVLASATVLHGLDAHSSMLVSHWTLNSQPRQVQVAVHQILASRHSYRGYLRNHSSICNAFPRIRPCIRTCNPPPHPYRWPHWHRCGPCTHRFCLTVVAFISIATVACVPIHEICTLPMGCTWRGGALVDVRLAYFRVLAAHVRGNELIPSLQVPPFCMGGMRSRRCFLAAFPEARCNDERVDSSLHATVFAWVGCTFVDVCLARTSRVPCGARASERVDSVLASATVFAWVGCAFVHVCLARTSGIYRRGVSERLIPSLQCHRFCMGWMQSSMFVSHAFPE